MADAVTANIKTKQDHIDSFRELTSDELDKVHKKVIGESKTENAAKAAKIKATGAKNAATVLKAAKDLDKATKTAADAEIARIKAVKIRDDAALAQKEPEDFSADEKEAA